MSPQVIKGLSPSPPGVIDGVATAVQVAPPPCCPAAAAGVPPSPSEEPPGVEAPDWAA